MKLPQVQYRGVQRLGRVNTGAITQEANSILATSQTQQQTMGMLAGVAADYIERKENAEYNEVLTSYSMELAEWKSRHDAKQFYTSEEIGEGIPEDVVPRTVTGTDDDGVQFTEYRDSIPAHEVYPHLLQQKLQGMIEEKANRISNPAMRNAFIQKAGVDASDMMMRVTVAAEQQQQAYTLEVGTNRAQEAADKGDIVSAHFQIDQLETDEETKRLMKEDAWARVEIFQVTQAIRSSDPEHILEARSRLEDEKYDGDLTEGQRQQAIRDLDNRLTQLAAETNAEMAKQHEAFISDANVGIDNGTFTLQDVEAGYQRWHANDKDPTSISGVERTRLRARINARNAALKNQKDLVGWGESLINNGGDPKDSNDQKAIDAFVEDEGSGNNPRRMEEITIRSNIMPQPLERFLNIAALHDAEKGGENIQVAIETYGRLSDMKPAVLAELGKESRDILANAHILNRGGMDVMDAYAKAREISEVKPEVKEQRDIDYRGLDVANDNPGILADLMDEDDTFFGFEGSKSFLGMVDYSIAPNQKMIAQFNTFTRLHYATTGDITMARNRAWHDMRQTWSATGVGMQLIGDEPNSDMRATQYAPERVMAVSTEVATQRLEAFARHEGLDAENLSVVSDDRTARDGSWQIWTYNPETAELKFHPERWVGVDWAEKAADHTYNEAVKEAIAERLERQGREEDRKRFYRNRFNNPNSASQAFGDQIGGE